MDYGVMFDKIRKLVEEDPDNITILEEIIDVELQMKYFKASVRAKKNLDVESVLLQKESLFSSETTLTEKKRILNQLASINEVEAYRTIERFVEEADPELSGWATLAFQESRMLIQSSLLDKAPVFISTGLGGRKNKLRYFVVFICQKGITIESIHQSVVLGELDFVAKKSNSEIEEVIFFDNYCQVLMMIPLRESVRELLSEVVKSCNELGNFLTESFLVTNVKKLASSDIEAAIVQFQNGISVSDDSEFIES